ncbi:phosphocholine cytidylyltransferase family protein [Vibrio parahaemolyticus]|uniref:Bifunctional IPC transferase and DIPP synthase n=3 Tax=Vibrio parahaemolyticus TaxID=670 RepID=A0A7M1VQA2_VIBPH|nr:MULTISPECIES: phosphocholine cytidylyltransferase family protein [Vibrio harveyi group]EGR0436573.1 phosphocholine cytidylyltransferase family protein [Vibrio parahaemolyticus]EGR3326788.1 phosphocholine cytidylyltransferase family protein [Vibrio parahaemolyticus]ELJ8798727.1 phosphocholine cytidylyltransferase family protein [Vibrio parahaemolyticus]MBO1666756.1 phosphocholine cytidylyltransferase family protein [Vibrio parahaemolyticus]MDI7847784.1 phosphocholine cytidylyltransferase fam
MTKAIILAAGQGTRLRPITNDRPKCLVELKGKSLLERQVKTLNSQGIHDIQVVTGYLSEKIESLGYNTSFNARYKESNMVESLFSAIEFIKNCNEDLIIGYGDIIYDEINLEALMKSESEVSIMIDKEWLALWSLRLDNPLDDAETLVMDNEGYITELGKKPENYAQIQGQYTGLIKVKAGKIKDFISFYEDLDREVLYDNKNFENMYMTSFIQLLINSGWKVKASLVCNGWLEIDSVEDLIIYEKLAETDELNKFISL